MEVTCRTIHGRFLLKPTRELRSIAIGVLARTQRLYPVELHAFVFLSNHYHLLLSVQSAFQLAQFMNYLNSNLAREAGRLNDWGERFWGRRYQAIVVSDEEPAQLNRLRYVLSHGCKEGLVAKPHEWPGAHSVEALVRGRELTGLWFDRSREYEARTRGEKFDRLTFAASEVIQLEPLPCWSHLSAKQHRNRVRELVAEIELETALRHRRERSRPIGVAQIIAQDSHDKPRDLKKGCAPLFHAATRAVRRELVESYRWFVSSYRQAAESLRQGNRQVSFPRGCFPPRLPFVGLDLPWVPG